MKKIILGMCLFIGLSGYLSASTWDDIARLEEAKLKTQMEKETERKILEEKVRLEMEKKISLHKLSDGREVNLANWTIVLFMQSTCSFCQQFDPILSAYTKDIGLAVAPMSMDGKSDGVFENVMLATPEIMVEFFGNGLPIATPTTFLVNVNTMSTYPLLQGAVDRQGLASRIDEVFRIALNKGEK